MDRYTFDRGRGPELFILAAAVKARLAALQAQHTEAMAEMQKQADRYAKLKRKISGIELRRIGITYGDPSQIDEMVDALP